MLVRFVTPVLDRHGSEVYAEGADGRVYRVVQEARDRPLLDSMARALETGIVPDILRLEGHSRNLIRNGRAGYASDLLRGRARAFALIQPRRRVLANGMFAQVFVHELAHVIMRRVLPGIETTPSSRMHMCMNVTDYATALDEGYAECLQVLAHDHTVQGASKPPGPPHLWSLWQSEVDTRLRHEGLKKNLFIYEKLPSEVYSQRRTNPYEAFFEAETSVAFDTCRLKNAQQMVSCEGVVATLLYYIVNDTRLQTHYYGPEFYERFVPDGSACAEPMRCFGPLMNQQLKILAALFEMRGRGLSWRNPLALHLITTYATMFPAEAESVYDLFIKTTMGVTVSNDARKAYEQMAMGFKIYDINASKANFARVSRLQAELAKSLACGGARIDENIGPELWLVNHGFEILCLGGIDAASRSLPLSMNLNTASVHDLTTLPGIDFGLAQRIINARDGQGFSRSVTDIEPIRGVPPRLVEFLREETYQASDSNPPLWTRQ